MLSNGQGLLTYWSNSSMMARSWRRPQHQIEWGVARFLGGERSFRPFQTFRPEAVSGLLKNAASLKTKLLERIRSQKEQSDRRWDEMQTQGRPSLQAALKKGLPIPEAGDWMNSILDSEFTVEAMLDGFADESERRQLVHRAHEYILWNPICRCFLEQWLLAIRRHGIEHRTASSKQGVISSKVSMAVAKPSRPKVWAPFSVVSLRSMSTQ
jgi:hypothetical protein